MLALILLAACRVAVVQDACVEDPDLCPACASDDACAFTGNPCLDTVYCAHVDAEIAVAELGCSEALEYAWPDPEACRCVETTCRSDE